MYIQDMEKRQKKYAEYWAKENHDRPILSITAPRKNAKKIQGTKYPGSLRESWWDEDWLIKNARASMENTYFAGEALPILNPNLGPDVFAAYLGCELDYGDDTSWSIHMIDDWADHHFTFDPENIYWKKIYSMTEHFLKDSAGDYLVGLTDIHQGMDALVSLRGPEAVCLDVFDSPEEVRRVLAEIEEVFKTTLYKSFELVEKYQKGTTNWMGIYHPGRWYVSSSDFIYLISPDTFDEFSSESIRREAEIIGDNIYHLDGVGSARHLDKLLEMPEINGIQWVYGAGQPTAAHWIDLLKRVQAAGKMIEVNCVASDIMPLLESGLKPEGLRFSLGMNSEEEADQMIRDVERFYAKNNRAKAI